MSYCRGDVYCYGGCMYDLAGVSQPYWSIHISYLLDSAFSGAAFELHSEEDLLDKFIALKAAGVPVPENAIKRVKQEIEEKT